MNGSNTDPSYTSSSSSFTECSSSPFFLPTVPPLSPSTHLTDDPDRSIILEHVFYCLEPDLLSSRSAAVAGAILSRMLEEAVHVRQE